MTSVEQETHEKAPFINYVSTCRGGGVESENANFCLFLVLKACLRRGEGVQKSYKCAYVIYEWSHSTFMVLNIGTISLTMKIWGLSFSASSKKPLMDVTSSGIY